MSAGREGAPRPGEECPPGPCAALHLEITTRDVDLNPALCYPRMTRSGGGDSLIHTARWIRLLLHNRQPISDGDAADAVTSPGSTAAQLYHFDT